RARPEHPVGLVTGLHQPFGGRSGLGVRRVHGQAELTKVEKLGLGARLLGAVEGDAQCRPAPGDGRERPAEPDDPEPPTQDGSIDAKPRVSTTASPRRTIATIRTVPQAGQRPTDPAADAYTTSSATSAVAPHVMHIPVAVVISPSNAS